MTHLHGKFVWFEHFSPSTPKARAFYDPLFNWHTESMPMGGPGPGPYPLIMNGEDGIGGFRAIAPSGHSHWLAYVSVDDVDERFAAAMAAGARGIHAPTDFGSVGRGATFIDPAGAMLALWKGARGDPADVPQVANGSWLWCELNSPQPAAALDFYEPLFGYTHDDMPGPDGSTYRVLKKDGVGRGGIAAASGPSAWLPYVKVADCDATAARAQALGGQLRQAPTDIPGIGRMAVLIDPQGAALAVMKPC